MTDYPASKMIRALWGLVSAFLLTSAAHAAAAQDLHDLNGVWYFEGSPFVIFQNPSLTPEYQEVVKRQMEMFRRGGPPTPPNEQNYCGHSPSFPSMMLGTYPFEILVTPEVVVTLHELDRGMRHIYLDGRGHEPGDKRSNTGDSIARWEGDTLVVETTNLPKEGTVGIGLPHSDQVRITERIHKTGADTMEYSVIVDDPKVLTRPASIVRTYRRHADYQILEYTCGDNLRSFAPTTE